MCRITASFAVLVLIAGSLAAQQPATAQSTAQEGQLLPGPFSVYAVNGVRAKHFQCFFVQHDLNPVVAVIALQPPANAQDPLGSLLQKLDAFAVANKQAKFGCFAIFATLEKPYLEDLTRDAKAGVLEGLIKTLPLQGEMSLGLTHPEAQSLKQFGVVTRDDQVNSIKRHQVTVLVYNKHKVEKRFTFTAEKKLDDAAITEILAAAEKTVPAPKGK
jgi:hypothetical protein